MSTRQVKWIKWLPAAVLLGALVAEAGTPTAADPPDADFLEFLGSWASGNDRPKWVDPFQLNDPLLLETDEMTNDRSSRERQDDSKQKQRRDNSPAREPSSSSVRPGGGMNP